MMRRLLRWFGFAAAGLAALAVVSAIVVYGLSERVLRRRYPPPAAPTFAAALPADSAALAEGRRLAVTRGCYGGCHGQGLAGSVFFDEPGVARLVAPDLTAAARRYSDAELERIVRLGVRPDGRSVFGMPSQSFHDLSDDDLGRILAFIRGQPPAAGGFGPSLHVGPLGRVGLVTARFEPTAVIVRRDAVGTTPRAERPGVDDSLALGRYLARTACAECHGGHLRGGLGPALVVAAAYTPSEFDHLLRTGEAKGGRELGLMSRVARSRFSLLTNEEVAALHAYLRTLASSTSTVAGPAE